MVTTAWIAGSGDWNTGSNWSNGVPTAADDAVFGPDSSSYYSYTVTGDGPALSLTVIPGQNPSFAGTHATGNFGVNQGLIGLLGSAALSFGSGTVSGNSQLVLSAGASLSSGALTLNFGTLGFTSGVLANPLTLVTSGSVSAKGGTLSGMISGSGVLNLVNDVVLANPGNTYTGGTTIQLGSLNHVELAAGHSAGSGAIGLGTGTLTLDPGAIVGPISAGFSIVGHVEIDATDQTLTVFAGPIGLTYNNGGGHGTVVAGIQPVSPYGLGYGQTKIFGSTTVQGGTGSVTVYGGNSGGEFHGGSAGNNVLFGGADLSGFAPVEDGGYLQDGSAFSPTPVTMYGGGDNDLLVATGTDNSYPSAASKANILVAAGGRETLTGSGSSGRNVFFGSSGADVIAAGAGASTIVGGIGIATISGGSGSAAIFAGAGRDVLLGGSGADYIQAGAGNATLFVGSGMDLIGVVNGQAGGSLVVSGFRTATDRISAQGYAAAPVVTTGGGNTVLTFSDHTQVTLLGVASLPGAAFS